MVDNLIKYVQYTSVMTTSATAHNNQLVLHTYSLSSVYYRKKNYIFLNIRSIEIHNIILTFTYSFEHFNFNV